MVLFLGFEFTVLGLRFKILGLNTRDEHGSGLKPILAASGLDQTAIFLKIGRSGLDRTEKIFVVLM